MSTYNIVLSTSESTVVTEYEPQGKRSDAYQSEAELEKEFIRLLSEQAYEYLPIQMKVLRKRPVKFKRIMFRY